jgi:WD40 repeat protein
MISIATASEGCGAMGKEMGDVANGVWLAAAYTDGTVRIWSVETARCVATLHPMFDMHETFGCCVSVAPDRSRVVHFMAPHRSNPGESGGLHVWDLSSDGTQERYAFVHGCKNQLGFELASAVLFFHESKRSSVEKCSSRAVRLSGVVVCSRK